MQIVFGKRSQQFNSRAKLASVVFRFAVGLYLCASAAYCVQSLTGIPAWLVMVGEALLCVQFPGKPAWCSLRRDQTNMLLWALLLLGSAYRVAGHASVLTVCVVMGYWAAVLHAQRGKNSQ
jgi:hypothetical protein